MSTVARDRIRRCLAMVPLIRARPGIRVPELASIFGVREEEIWEDLTEVLTLCGVPPYLPHNYLVFAIHGDRVSIRFAEHLARPVHLTLQEALAIDLALRSVSGGRPPAFGDAAPRLRRKLRELLGGREREALEAFDRSVAGTPPSDLVVETILKLKDAMARNRAVRVEYYTSSRDAVSMRTLAPYGLIDHRGSWYVIACDLDRAASGAPTRAVPFRVDALRDVTLLSDREYEVPEDFTTEAFRRDDMWTEGPDDIVVEVRFTAAAAGRVREEAERRDVSERPGGEVLRRYRIQKDRPRWLYGHLARYGDQAEVLGPPEIRRGMAGYLSAVLERQVPRGEPRGEGQAARPEAHAGGTRATAAAARPRPRQASTRKKPSAR
jgi:proteasome accessory factor C